MKEVAIYALLNGISYTAEIHKLEESTVRRWIRDLDYENEPFFTRLRDMLLKTSKKAGVEKTAELFGMPVNVINILSQEEQQQADSQSTPSQSSIKPEASDENRSKALKRRALRMHLRGRSIHYISQHLKINAKKIKSWISVFKQLKNPTSSSLPIKKYKHEEEDSTQSSIPNSQTSYLASDSEIEVLKVVRKPIEVIELEPSSASEEPEESQECQAEESIKHSPDDD
jgi:transposase-like protein